jgi:hypothetical protein
MLALIKSLPTSLLLIIFFRDFNIYYIIIIYILKFKYINAIVNKKIEARKLIITRNNNIELKRKKIIISAHRKIS